jgi:hypothetical protein
MSKEAVLIEPHLGGVLGVRDGNMISPFKPVKVTMGSTSAEDCQRADVELARIIAEFQTQLNAQEPAKAATDGV